MNDRARQMAAALIRCMDFRDTPAAEALTARLWREDRRLFDAAMGEVWRIEAARAAQMRKRRRKAGRPRGSGELRPCGTEAAYDRHLYWGEVPCGACVEAERGRKARQRGEAREAGRAAA